jgi:hypothetical protein
MPTNYCQQQTSNATALSQRLIVSLPAKPAASLLPQWDSPARAKSRSAAISVRNATRLRSRTAPVAPVKPTEPVLIAVSASVALFRWFRNSCAKLRRVTVFRFEQMTVPHYSRFLLAARRTGATCASCLRCFGLTVTDCVVRLGTELRLSVLVLVFCFGILFPS